MHLPQVWVSRLNLNSCCFASPVCSNFTARFAANRLEEVAECSVGRGEPPPATAGEAEPFDFAVRPGLCAGKFERLRCVRRVRFGALTNCYCPVIVNVSQVVANAFA